MTWVDSFFSWFYSILPSPQLFSGVWSALHLVADANPWMWSIWTLFQQIIAMFFALAPMAPAIFLFMAFMAIVISIEKLSPDPLIDFVMTLYNFALAVIGTIAAVVDMVIPF
jgi:hypothetical protein